jgi:hypothetical protein
VIPERGKTVKRISVIQLRQDIRVRLSHEKLMDKYGLSEGQMKQVFGKLMHAVENGQTHIVLRDY